MSASQLNASMRSVIEGIRLDQTLLKYAVSINEKSAVKRRISSAKASLKRLMNLKEIRRKK